MLRQKIKEFVNSKPNHDVDTYTHVSKVGYKYVTIVDLYSCKSFKVTLDSFYNRYK